MICDHYHSVDLVVCWFMSSDLWSQTLSIISCDHIWGLQLWSTIIVTFSSLVLVIYEGCVLGLFRWLELFHALAIAVVVLCPESPIFDIFISWRNLWKRMVVLPWPLPLSHKFGHVPLQGYYISRACVFQWCEWCPHCLRLVQFSSFCCLLMQFLIRLSSLWSEGSMR